MPLQQLQFRPGVNREGTTLSNEGGWFECDKVRFRSGYPEKIGGWVPLSNQTYDGSARSLFNWVTNNSYNLLGIGTNSNYYIENGGVYNDVTPYRVFAQSGSAPNCFTTTNTSNVVTVTITNHNLVADDVVYFENSTTVDGIPAAQLNTRHVVTSVFNANAFAITVTTAANASTTGGGANVTYQSYPFQQRLINPFTTISGSSIVTVTDENHGATTGDAVTFSGASAVGGLTINGSYRITYVNSNTYTINAGSNASSSATGGGTVVAKYELNVGLETYATFTGWGAGYWGGFDLNAAVDYLNGGINASATTITVISTTGFPAAGSILIDQELISYTGITATQFTGCVRGISGTTATSHNNNAVVYSANTFAGWGQSTQASFGSQLRLWSQAAYGEYLVINPRNGALYMWIPTLSATETFPALDIHAKLLSPNSASPYETDSNCPSVSTMVMVSDSSRFLISFGCNDYGSTVQSPLLIRWSDQENYAVWTPAITNQAGSFLLSSGSSIVTAIQTRQEILVFTDASVWSMKYVGAPFVWSFDILSHNISIIGPNAIAAANNIVYWMGTDKFYVYTGRVETLPCSLRQYVFNDINMEQSYQFFAGGNEGYSEVWWFYCSANSTVIDRYVIYNYLDKVWYYGTLNRTAWLDSPLRDYPMAATYSHTIVYHENGADNVEASGNPLPIEAYIQSSDFDIGDGHNFGFVWRVIPDITFDGSTTPAPNKPEVTFTVRPRQNPGAAYGAGASPLVQSAQSYANQKTYTVQEFTEIVYTRVRGRQMAFKVSSNTLGTQWQLGVPRIDTRPDGRRLMANLPDRLTPLKAPALPMGPTDYSRQYQDQLNNVLRLYFTLIDSQSQGMLSNVGGRFLGFPHGSFYDTETQSDGINTPNAVQLNGTFSDNTLGFTIQNNAANKPTRVTAEYPGIYNFQFSLQLENTDNAQHEVGIWARINGVDIPFTSTDITVPARKSALIFGYAVAAWNFMLPMQGNDYFELMWATDSTLVTIPYKGAQTSPYIRPAIPSTILTVSFVSAIPA